jgi:hypothetical protein
VENHRPLLSFRTTSIGHLRPTGSFEIHPSSLLSAKQPLTYRGVQATTEAAAGARKNSQQQTCKHFLKQLLVQEGIMIWTVCTHHPSVMVDLNHVSVHTGTLFSLEKLQSFQC